MNRKIICLVLLIMIIFTSPVFATSWVYYGRNGSVSGNVYIDADSVMKNGDNLSFWELFVYDKPIGTIAKLTTKYEVILAPSRKYRIASSCYYLANNQEDKEANEWNDADKTTGKWADSFVGKNMSAETDFVLKYAKEGKETGAKPSP